MEILTFENSTVAPGSSSSDTKIANALRENGLTREEVQVVKREKVFYIMWKDEKYQMRIGENKVVDIEMVKKMVNPPAPPPEFWFRRSDNPPVTHSRLTYDTVTQGETYNITAHRKPILTNHSAGYRVVVDVLPGQSTKTAVESIYEEFTLPFTVTESGKVEELPIEIVVKDDTGNGKPEFRHLVKPGSLHIDTMNAISREVGEDPQYLKIQNEKGDSLGYGRSLAQRPPPRKVIVSKTVKKRKFDIFNIGYEHAEFISTNFNDADIARTLSCRLNISPSSITVNSAQTSADIHKQEYHVVNSLTGEEKKVKLPYKSLCRPGFLGICDDFNVNPDEWVLFFSKGLEVVSDFLREKFYYIAPKTATIFVRHQETDALLTMSVLIYKTSVEELTQEAEFLLERPPNSTQFSNASELDVTSLSTLDELTLVNVPMFDISEGGSSNDENTFYISSTCGVFTKSVVKKESISKNAPFGGVIQPNTAMSNLLIICIPIERSGSPFEFSLKVPTISNMEDLRRSILSSLSTNQNPSFLRKLERQQRKGKGSVSENVPHYELNSLESVMTGSQIDDNNISEVISQTDSSPTAPIRLVALLKEVGQTF